MNAQALSAFLFTLALPLAGNGAEPLILAPGKSIKVVDAADSSIQVVLTAPAGEPLDVGALLEALGPDGNLQSLATRQQAKPAASLVKNSDGSFSLGVQPAPASAAATVAGGVVVFDRGTYALQAEAPPPPRPVRPDPLVDSALGRDPGLSPSLNTLRTRVSPAQIPNPPNP